MQQHTEAGAVSRHEGQSSLLTEEPDAIGSSPTPPSDNMGVNNATGGGSTAPTVPAKAVSPRPEDYFHRLALDTLQVSVKGRWLRPSAAESLLAKRRSAETCKLVGLGIIRVEAPGDRLLEVKPHGGQPCYQVLMRDADGLEVRAIPSGKMPPFIFRFGARWCNEHSRAELAVWLLAFLSDLGFAAEKIQLSEVHIRCDSPVPFVEADTKRMRGTGTRNGRFNFRREKDRLSGIDNLGGKKPIKFVIYNKRLEQSTKGGHLWPAIWRGYGIGPEVPIWRVEARFNRKALTYCGFDHLADLTDRAIAELWGRFSSRYLFFISDEGKRTDRSVATRKWAKIQACGKLVEPRPIVADVDVTATQLFKQAAGCIAKALAISGVGSVEADQKNLVELVIADGVTRFNERRPELTEQLTKSLVDRSLAQAAPRPEIVLGALGPAIRRASEKCLTAKTFSPVPTISTDSQ